MKNKDRIEKLFIYVLNNNSKDLNIKDIVAITGISRHSIFNYFKKNSASTPLDLLWSFRVYIAAKYIQQCPDVVINDFINTIGFKHSSHFSRLFRSRFILCASKFKQLQYNKNKIKINKIFFENFASFENFYIQYEDLFKKKFTIMNNYHSFNHQI